MVKKTIDEFGRIRLGKPETVSTHIRTYDIKPKLNKKTKDDIKTGKAKELIEKKVEEFECDYCGAIHPTSSRCKIFINEGLED